MEKCAHNKMLAKLASALHKPSKQTLVPVEHVDRLMASVPLRELRGLGGKLGEAVEALPGMAKGCSASDCQQYSEAELASHLGEKAGRWLYQACRGIDSEPVEPKDRVKSILAAKTFPLVRDEAAVEGWLRVLATELVARVEVDRGLGSACSRLLPRRSASVCIFGPVGRRA